MSRPPFALAVVLIALLAASVASAGTSPPPVFDPEIPVVYDRDAGPNAVKQLGATDAETVRLYIHGGADSSGSGEFCEDCEEFIVVEICENAMGDELCGIDITVTVDGDSRIVGFVPPVESLGEVVHFPVGPSFPPTTQLRLNVLQADPSNPPFPGAQELGTLTIDTFDGGSLSASVRAGGQAVRADGSLRSVPERVIAVPEPARILLLVSGIAYLSSLARIRMARGDDC